MLTVDIMCAQLFDRRLEGKEKNGELVRSTEFKKERKEKQGTEDKEK
jgi:hypothetical protein